MRIKARRILRLPFCIASTQNCKCLQKRCWPNERSREVGTLFLFSKLLQTSIFLRFRYLANPRTFNVNKTILFLINCDIIKLFIKICKLWFFENGIESVSCFKLLIQIQKIWFKIKRRKLGDQKVKESDSPSSSGGASGPWPDTLS